LLERTSIRSLSFASDVDAVVDLLNKQGYVPVEDFLNFVKAADVFGAA